MTPHGKFHWNELMTRDVERAKAFYENAIGWTFNGMEMPEGTYWVAMVGEEPAGGMFEMKGDDFEGVPDHWMAYLSVDDVDACVAKATADGATIMRPPFDVEGIGRIALLKEPGGAAIGWMTPAKTD
ncbi:MAG: VOC family protein [Alphaproteobacteria bacterium]|nr:VOC family protein [Alphaproteobacteria bacterium]